MVFLGDICFKLLFWPFLSYFVNKKGILCPYNRPFPIITLPPGVTLTPPIIPTVPTIPTTVACPAFPVVCMPNGLPPNPQCPCIDPRRGVAVAATVNTSDPISNAKLVVGSKGSVIVPLQAGPVGSGDVSKAVVPPVTLQSGPIANSDGLVFQQLATSPSPTPLTTISPTVPFRSNGTT